MTLREHLKIRNYDTTLHRAWLDEDNAVATFPLWNLNGQLCGYQAYRPDADKVKKNDEKGRYYTYRGDKLFRKQCKSVAIWGLESWHLSNVLFVTEGVFDAARLTNIGISAVALLSNNPDSITKNWLYCVRQMRPVVAVCDPGSAGRKLAKVGHSAHVVNIPGQPDADLGDAPKEYVDNMIKTYIV